MPKVEKALEDVSVQPLAHLAAPTVRTFELVYSCGKTEVILSAETVEDMKKKHVGPLGLVRRNEIRECRDTICLSERVTCYCRPEELRIGLGVCFPPKRRFRTNRKSWTSS